MICGSDLARAVHRSSFLLLQYPHYLLKFSQSRICFRRPFSLLGMDADTLPSHGGGGGVGDRKTDISGASPPPEDPDLPPESIRVPIGGDGGVDWAYLNAVFERDDSTKGSTNPKSSHANPKSKSISELSSTSLKAKPPVIGLANSIRPSGFNGRPSRRQPTGRIFAKKGSARTGGESAVADPKSPEVSCFGKVLSDGERKGKRRRLWLCGLDALLGCGGVRRGKKSVVAGTGERVQAAIAGGASGLAG